MNSEIIQEPLELPSKGIGYQNKIKSLINLRGMTTEDEMIRLNKTDLPFFSICKMIDNCFLDKPGISSYDMHLIDYQAALIKLRVITYGKDYRINSLCQNPFCNNLNKATIDLNEVKFPKIKTLIDDLKTTINNESSITFKYVTPRLLDLIRKRVNEAMERHGVNEDVAILTATPTILIDQVEGKTLDEVELDTYLRKLPMKDMNIIQKYCKKILDNSEIKLEQICSNSKCKMHYTYGFPFSREFFGPEID